MPNEIKDKDKDEEVTISFTKSEINNFLIFIEDMDNKVEPYNIESIIDKFKLNI